LWIAFWLAVVKDSSFLCLVQVANQGELQDTANGICKKPRPRSKCAEGSGKDNGSNEENYYTNDVELYEAENPVFDNFSVSDFFHKIFDSKVHFFHQKALKYGKGGVI